MRLRNTIVYGSCLVLMLSAIPLLAPANSSMQYYGPYVDKITYKVITGDNAQVLALLDNEIDLVGDMIDPSFLPQLEESEDIEIANVLRNGYGYFSINCDKYPFNITAFRRALAFALDKEAICDDIWSGLAQPQDSCVPVVNPFSIEGQLPYTYYEGNLAKANALLDAAGFFDIDEDGSREAPDGSDFDVLVELAQSSGIAERTGELFAETMRSIGIDAVAKGAYFYDYLCRLYHHGDYDIVYMSTSFSEYSVDWLAYEYWSEYADEPYWNFPNFRNASYDSWRDQLLHSVQYEDVYEAAIEMQKIFVYECPIIVCYENVLLSAYRTDRFVGFVNDVNDGVPNWWTNYQVRLKDAAGGPYGGNLRWSLPFDIDTFNFMTSISSFANTVNQMMWDSLLRMDPDGNYIHWLAESYNIETHADNRKVPDEHTRIIFQMRDDLVWSDGRPLTADDVAFSLNYYRNAPGNPLGADIADIMSAYSITPSEMVVEFKSESYWHLTAVALKPIIPKHIFIEPDFPAWNEWNPDPTDPNEPYFVSSGPFIVNDFVPGEFAELTYNSYYRSSSVTGDDNPYIERQDDVYISEGTVGKMLTWNCSCSVPCEYSILRDGSLIDSGVLEGTNVSISLDSLSYGTYNYTLILSTRFGSSTSDDVLVHIRRNDLLNIPVFSLSMAITISSLVVIAAFGSAIIKNH
ncbi:MAG: putative Dipeptide-binding protein DppE [Candidatus Thorarchaeota archaeon]|nr:MAG: putative Dipeptide-binding protein DppE [Candidatus Thorarchaeota archaeon]